MSYTGDISLEARLWQYDGSYYDPFGVEGYDQSKYRVLLDSETETFSVDTYTPSGFVPSHLGQVPEFECSLTELIGCMKNAGVWLFYPDPQATDRFRTLSEDLKGKFPFAYVYGIGQMRNELFGSTQTASSTVSASIRGMSFTFISQDMLSAVPFASLIKTILGWLLWIMAMTLIYKRVMRIHDNNSNV